MEFCISDLIGGIAGVVGGREAIVTPDARITWSDLEALSTAVARGFVDAGLGVHEGGDTAKVSDIADRIGSVQDHVGILCGNCPEYLLTMIGAFRSRVVPVNMNYRYTPAELVYLLDNADLRAVVYQERYAPALAEAIATGTRPGLLVRIQDGSGTEPVAGSVDWDEFVAAGLESSAPLPVPSADDRYILYTGGTTGFPKGVIWRQEDLYFAALGGALQGVKTPREVVDKAAKSRTLPGLPASPMMHGAGHWSSFILLLQGGTVVLPPEPDRLDPDGIWMTVDREAVVYMAVVGDAFLGPLIESLETGRHDGSTLRFLITSGAIVSPARKAALLALIPRLRILDAMGASESGQTAASEARDPYAAGGGVRFRLQKSARVVRTDDVSQPVGVGEEGYIAQTGHVPLGYYKDAGKTAATFPVIDGRRYSVPGDLAVLLEDGELKLLGRGSQCINTGGEKVYPEEVEQVLKSHPAVSDALVAGVADDRFGQAVGAVVAVRAGVDVDEADLSAHLRERLAGYKVPRRWVLGDRVSRNPVGKPDYAWAREMLAG